MSDAPPISIVVFAPHGAPAAGVRTALDSALEQRPAGAEVVVAGDLRAAETADLLVPHEGDFEPLHLPEDPPAALRVKALARLSAPLVTLIDPHEKLTSDGLTRQLESLQEDPSLVAAYGRVAVQERGRVRVRPEHGKGGNVFSRLLKEKHLVSASAGLVWRREAAGPTAFRDYTTPPALRLALALDLAASGPFVFHPAVVAERTAEEPDLPQLEELVKVLLSVLYGPEPIDERVEQPARVRLARHLVAIGKLYYRSEDYPRAGKFFDQAVKAAPAYFKGRRYQFLNFVKNTLTRE